MLYTWDEKSNQYYYYCFFLKSHLFNNNNNIPQIRAYLNQFIQLVFEMRERRKKEREKQRESKIKLLWDAHEESHKHNNNKKKLCVFILSFSVKYLPNSSYCITLLYTHIQHKKTTRGDSKREEQTFPVHLFHLTQYTDEYVCTL